MTQSNRIYKRSPSARETRLRCLELAILTQQNKETQTSTLERLIELAEKYYEWATK